MGDRQHLFKNLHEINNQHNELKNRQNHQHGPHAPPKLQPQPPTPPEESLQLTLDHPQQQQPAADEKPKIKKELKEAKTLQEEVPSNQNENHGHHNNKKKIVHNSTTKKKLKEKSPCQTLSAWNINYDDQQIASKRMINWLSFYQNRCVNRTLSWNFRGESAGGYGSYIVSAFQGLMEALERDQIYFPRANFIWSYNDTSRCSRGIPAADCFSQPFTFCSPSTPNLPNFPAFIDITDALKLYPVENNNLDLCSLGKASHKTVSWVMGHLVLYLLRPSPEIQSLFQSDLSFALKLLQSGNNKRENQPDGQKCLSATIYLRRGKMDWGRHSVDGSQHLAVLHQMNKEMLGTGEQICTIYIASNDPNGTIFRNASIAPNQMVSIFGFQVLSLSRFLGDTSKGVEMEHQLPLLKQESSFKPEQSYVEYLVDLWLMVEADIFVGAWSNNMVLASMLRAAVHPERWQNRTCMLDTTAKPPDRFGKWCMGTPQMQKHFHVPGPEFPDGSMYTTDVY